MVNRSRIDSSRVEGKSLNNNFEFATLAISDAGRCFDGIIDEAALYDVTLTADDVNTIMGGWNNILAVSASGKLATTWADIKD